ncbi:hypothetical protein E0K83_07625 [Gramella sp. BOM4]|nr:hypothetical protein [Christiangramia bathymodioli]
MKFWGRQEFRKNISNWKRSFPILNEGEIQDCLPKNSNQNNEYKAYRQDNDPDMIFLSGYKFHNN